MRIGIIGSGNIGGTAAKLLVDAGHEVALSHASGPESLRNDVAALGPRTSGDHRGSRRLHRSSSATERQPAAGCCSRRCSTPGSRSSMPRG
jgi:predicted dinucleotide-binding enzyme